MPRRFQNSLLTNYFKIYFDWAYIFCCSPFRLKLTYNENPSSLPRYVGVSFAPQKILCLVLTFLQLFWMLRELRLAIPTDSKNPTMYFEVVGSLASSSLKLISSYIFWFRQDNFIEILNFINMEHNQTTFTNNPISKGHTHINSKSSSLFSNNKVTTCLLGLLYTAFSLGTWGTGSHIGFLKSDNGHISKWSLTWFWNAMVEAGYFNFFMSDDSGGPLLDLVIGMLSVAGYLHRRLMAAYPDFLLIITVAMLRSAVISFTESILPTKDIMAGNSLLATLISSSSDKTIQNFNSNTDKANERALYPRANSNWESMKPRYNTLKQLTLMLNGLIGTTFGCYLLEVIIYFACTFDDLLRMASSDWVKITAFVIYICDLTMILYYCTDIPIQMKALKIWLSVDSNRQSVPVDELVMLLTEVETDVVAMRGGSEFAITYSLVAQMVGITVTYFIICIQA